MSVETSPKKPRDVAISSRTPPLRNELRADPRVPGQNTASYLVGHHEQSKASVSDESSSSLIIACSATTILSTVAVAFVAHVSCPIKAILADSAAICIASKSLSIDAATVALVTPMDAAVMVSLTILARVTFDRKFLYEETLTGEPSSKPELFSCPSRYDAWNFSKERLCEMVVHKSTDGLAKHCFVRLHPPILPKEPTSTINCSHAYVPSVSCGARGARRRKLPPSVRTTPEKINMAERKK
mmetsp:Transcript_47444/g.117448  ORF Transcript_47444/g.117448 Transcript_47444/m.117448 type:complete len:242 (-) Transcript_47444:1461-2186(-)